ncbi:MAG: F0F1 ATP synthase subunit A, partial [bacterium]|nr:F0F1 ATP synthase subunit A [bacterium]
FSLFIFILCSNLFTNLPGMGAWTIRAVDGTATPLFRSVLADYGAVLVLTLITVTVAQFAFIITQGLGKYLKQFFDFSNPINFFLGLMNLIGELAKILSLSFRLFGNVFAGEVLISIVTALIPFVVPLPFFVLSLFSSVIQAYVFAVLSTVFISANLDLPEKAATPSVAAPTNFVNEKV